MADVDRITGSGVMRREWRELARFVVESFVAGLVVSLVMALAVFIVTTPAHAATARAAAGSPGAAAPRTPAQARCTSRTRAARAPPRRSSSPTSRWT